LQLAKLLKHYEKKGFLKSKERNGDIQILSVNMNNTEFVLPKSFIFTCRIIAFTPYKIAGNEQAIRNQDAEQEMAGMQHTRLFRPISGAVDIFRRMQSRFDNLTQCMFNVEAMKISIREFKSRNC
jgi:hypothetical protein